MRYPEDIVMAKPKLTIYFDMHSPFAYLAFHVTKVSNSDLLLILNRSIPDLTHRSDEIRTNRID